MPGGKVFLPHCTAAGPGALPAASQKVSESSLPAKSSLASATQRCCTLHLPESCCMTKSNPSYCCRPFLQLLGDSEAGVRKAMLGNLAAFVEGIAGKSAKDDAKLGAELAAQVASLEASLGFDWRSQHSLLLAIPPLAQVCCAPLLNHKASPCCRRPGTGFCHYRFPSHKASSVL